MTPRAMERRAVICPKCKATETTPAYRHLVAVRICAVCRRAMRPAPTVQPASSVANG
jgi:hypothetical protein